MKYLLLLSKQDIRLAKEEAASLLKFKKDVLDKDLLVIDVPEDRIKLARRLAYTKEVYRVLFSCTSKELEGKMERYNWNKIYERDFSFRYWKKRGEEKKQAKHIWRNLGDDRKVNLKDAKTQIEVLDGKRLYCCLLIHKQEGNFESRKPHLRPGFSPVSLHPRLARCMVNLTGVEKGTILDPFCGTGGLLIEAGLMGLRVKGYDIDEEMLVMCEDNLNHYNIKEQMLVKKNALSIKNIDYVVTDLPYGKNTKKQDLEKLYSEFFIVLEKQLRKRAVIGMPSFFKYKKLIGKLKVVNEFSYYIHKSLSKRIVVFES